jgi:hypothetical protein
MAYWHSSISPDKYFETFGPLMFIEHCDYYYTLDTNYGRIHYFHIGICRHLGH